MKINEIPRGCWILFFGIFINRMGHMAFPFLVLFLTVEKKFSHGDAGFVLAVYGFASIAGALLSGFLSDKIEPKNIMRISLIGTAIVIFLFPIMSTYSAILITTVFWSLFAESFRPANMTLVNSFATNENRKIIFSFLRFAVNLGMSMGPALGGFLAESSFRNVFTFDASTTLLVGLLYCAYPLKSLRGKTKALESTAEILEGDFRAFKNLKYLLFLTGIIFIFMVYLQHESTLGIFTVEELKQPRRNFGFLFTINTLMIVFLEIPLNVRTAHWSHKRSLFLGATLYAIGFGILAFANSFWVLALAAVIWTCGEMIESPSSHAAVAEFAPKKRVGEYMGLLTMSYGIAFGLGPWLGLLLYQKFNSTVLWTICFVWALIGGFILRHSLTLASKTS